MPPQYIDPVAFASPASHSEDAQVFRPDSQFAEVPPGQSPRQSVRPRRRRRSRCSQQSLRTPKMKLRSGLASSSAPAPDMAFLPPLKLEDFAPGFIDPRLRTTKFQRRSGADHVDHSIGKQPSRGRREHDRTDHHVHINRTPSRAELVTILFHQKSTQAAVHHPVVAPAKAVQQPMRADQPAVLDSTSPGAGTGTSPGRFPSRPGRRIPAARSRPSRSAISSARIPVRGFVDGSVARRGLIASIRIPWLLAGCRRVGIRSHHLRCARS